MPANPKPLRVVVADDNQDAANTMSKLLMFGGYRVQAIAHDGHSALEAIRQLLPDAAILDLGMPELSGYEVAKRVRAEIQPCPYLIAVSGWGNSENKADALAAGFDSHVTKPAAWTELDGLLKSFADCQLKT